MLHNAPKQVNIIVKVCPKNHLFHDESTQKTIQNKYRIRAQPYTKGFNTTQKKIKNTHIIR